MSRKWEKSEEVFTTDPDIIMECLFEVYEKETPAVLSGKNIRHTMIYPFLKMLRNEFGDYTLESLHKMLWPCYQKEHRKEAFVEKGLYDLEQGRKKPETISMDARNNLL